MTCAMCKKPFELKERDYKRKSLINKSRSEETVNDALEVTVTPGTKEHFLCSECDKLTNTAATGHVARKTLFEGRPQDSYILRKQAASGDRPGPSTSTPAKRTGSPNLSPVRATIPKRRRVSSIGVC